MAIKKDTLLDHLLMLLSLLVVILLAIALFSYLVEEGQHYEHIQHEPEKQDPYFERAYPVPEPTGTEE